MTYTPINITVPGWSTQLTIDPNLPAIANLFNYNYFMSQISNTSYATLLASGLASGAYKDAYDFWAKVGIPAGLSPNKFYDENTYLTNNPALKAVIKGHSQNPGTVIYNSGLEHYLALGRSEILNSQYGRVDSPKRDILTLGTTAATLVATDSDVGSLFLGTDTTVVSGTVIHGLGAALSELDIIAAGALTQITVAGVPTIKVTALGAPRTYDATLTTDLTSIWSSNSQYALTVSNLNSNVSGVLYNSGTTTNDADMIMGYTDAVVAGASDLFTQTLQNSGRSNIATTNNPDITVNHATTGNFENIAFIASGTAGSYINTVGGTALAAPATTLTITGSKYLKIGSALPATVTTVDASGNTGGVDVLFAASAVTGTGGSGNDTFRMAALLTGATSIDGGAGTDTVGITDGTTLTALTGKKLHNIEVIDFGGGTGTYDSSLVIGSGSTSTITGLITSGLSAGTTLAGAVTLSNVNAGTPLTIAANTGANAITYTLKTNTASDVLSLIMNDLAVAVNAPATITTNSITATSVETINITSNGSSANTLNTIGTLVSTTLKAVTVIGATPLTIGALTNTGNSIETINASGMTGTAGFTLTSAMASTTSSSVILTTGGAALTTPLITGTANADHITLSSIATTASILGGVGIDTIVLPATGAANKVIYTTVNDGGTALGLGIANTPDVVTGFVIGEDHISIAGALNLAIAANTGGKATSPLQVSGAGFDMNVYGVYISVAANASNLVNTQPNAALLTKVNTAVGAVTNEVVGDTKVIVLMDDVAFKAAVYSYVCKTADSAITTDEIQFMGYFTGSAVFTATEVQSI